MILPGTGTGTSLRLVEGARRDDIRVHLDPIPGLRRALLTHQLGLQRPVPGFQRNLPALRERRVALQMLVHRIAAHPAASAEAVASQVPAKCARKASLRSRLNRTRRVRRFCSFLPLATAISTGTELFSMASSQASAKAGCAFRRL